MMAATLNDARHCASGEVSNEVSDAVRGGARRYVNDSVKSYGASDKVSGDANDTVKCYGTSDNASDSVSDDVGVDVSNDVDDTVKSNAANTVIRGNDSDSDGGNDNANTARPVVVIDNYDSFTYNLVQYLGELGRRVIVVRNDHRSVAEIEQLRPMQLVLSPGPCTPNEAGVSVDAVRHFAGRIGVLGVCLGHQCIAQAFGGRIVHAAQLMHGKTSPIHHNAAGLFRGVPSPFIATRYHSLALARDNVPACLEITAHTDDGEIMAVQHRECAIVGVQFHPESILTEHGKLLLNNFLTDTMQ